MPPDVLRITCFLITSSLMDIREQIDIGKSILDTAVGLAILTLLVVKLDITFSDQGLALGASNLTFVGKLHQLGLLLRIKE
jgi:hypothetical protein